MNHTIVEGRENLRLEDVVRLLKTTYWAKDRTPQQIEASMRHSACYGVLLEDGRLAGFARVITDRATTFYLADVIIDEAYRGHGLGKALVGHILSRPASDGLRGLLLTRDAHDLYRKFGYEVLDGRAMVKKLNC